MPILVIQGKAREVFEVLGWLSKVAGKLTLGEIIKFKEVKTNARTETDA